MKKHPFVSNHSQFTDEFIQKTYGQLLSFAKNQLGDSDEAFDVVQETFENAYKYANHFKGNSAFKTWVFAILKNKIADHIRQNQKYVNLANLNIDNQSDTDILQVLFDDIGHWQAATGIAAFDDSWQNPEQHAEQDSFWQVMELCLTNLPRDQAQVFLMKEYVELSTDEICQEIGISTQNFYVLMHRARLRLQRCLSLHWFNHDAV
ncbi:RNA polymerase sigma factor [Moraxella macacae 0408225]|uniref:RNA polymerase sigma factor n=1 Tax=Moraxella macacae 0408225 TaxID=1230338 RepID=L2F9L4_9GAMM|nr:sigma-70 family RNA polymerase sigma factor [Moraxella macacae]ELA09764.1 RNA polymerase sigma factor [Moraxella macacae 0408225]